jgi:AmmeMemoRadiSam system protein A
MQISAAHRQLLLNAARTNIRDTLRGNGRASIPPTTDPVLTMPAGCFVTLHDRVTHRLRGCIGRLQSNDPLIKSVCETACSTLQDPRFQNNPVTLDELSRLELEISVLSPLKEAANPLDFDPPNDGIYLLCDGRAGTFLPQVAKETGWTREQLLARLCTEKMGLAPTAWQNPQAKLLKYNVVIIGPEPFIPTPVRSEVVSFGNGNVFHV